MYSKKLLRNWGAALSKLAQCHINEPGTSHKYFDQVFMMIMMRRERKEEWRMGRKKREREEKEEDEGGGGEDEA